MIGALVTWSVSAVFVGLIVWGAWYVSDVARRRRRGEYVHRAAGGTLGFDEVWRPSAAEAQIVWEADQMTPIPAPTPDRGPSVIEGNCIVIETVSPSSS